MAVRAAQPLTEGAKSCWLAIKRPPGLVLIRFHELQSGALRQLKKALAHYTTMKAKSALCTIAFVDNAHVLRIIW